MANGIKNTGLVAAQQVRLKSDQVSIFYKNGKQPMVYARKGEILPVVAEHGNVLILQSKSGVKFPVNKENTI